MLPEVSWFVVTAAIKDRCEELVQAKAVDASMGLPTLNIEHRAGLVLREAPAA